MEGVVAAQVQEPRVPVHDVAFAPCDDRAQVVVDALARGAAEPLEQPRMALEKRLERHVEREVRRLRARVGQRADQRVDAPLAPGDPWPGRHLRPVELEHLAGAVAGALRRPLGRRPQLAQAAIDDADRAVVAALAQELGHPRRLDLRPLLEHTPQERLKRVELRALARAAVARRLIRVEQAADRAPVNPKPPRKLALRQPVRRHRIRLRPLQRAPHLPRPSCLDRPNRSSVRAQAVVTDEPDGALFAARFRCSIRRAASAECRSVPRAENPRWKELSVGAEVKLSDGTRTRDRLTVTRSPPTSSRSRLLHAGPASGSTSVHNGGSTRQPQLPAKWSPCRDSLPPVPAWCRPHTAEHDS
jgi:hypothetical protein